uniref:Peptidoglycan recognition protein 3-like n=1 Tax=Castor canadensis TaxID=51338 RepID=A0A8B7TTD2_CASCN|nr:peptidoglycan recognition protein 3-like [Castor canadensis]
MEASLGRGGRQWQAETRDAYGSPVLLPTGWDVPHSSWNETHAGGISEKLLDLFVSISQFIHKSHNSIPTIVSRKEWEARPLSCRALLSPPVAYLITEQLMGMECQEQSTCSQTLRVLQSHSVYNKGGVMWPSNLPLNPYFLAWQFLVGNDGRVYEGVGWHVQGLHTQGYNNVSLGIAFFGNKIACPNITPICLGSQRDTLPSNEPPVKYVIIIHTAGTSCSVPVDCQIRVRDTQSFHVDRRDFCDIGYHFLVGQDGGVYEGVGWHIQGSHTYGYNDIALGIAFMGNFVEKPPNAAALEAAQDLIQCAVAKGYLAPNYLLHICFNSTYCPREQWLEVWSIHNPGNLVSCTQVFNPDEPVFVKARTFPRVSRASEWYEVS